MKQSDALDTLLAGVDAIADELQALARPAEVARHAPAELGDLLRRARIPMAKVPEVVGGFELSPADQVDFFARLAWHNPTAAWLAFNQNGVAGLLGACLSEAGLARVFEHDAPLAAAVAAPTGRSTRCAGGYRVTGRWSYASGAHVAEWFALATLCDDPAGPRMVVLEPDQVHIDDNWHVGALQGTGSVDVEVADAFVPDELSFVPVVQLRGGPQYTLLGFSGYVAGENFGFSLGVAQRLVAEIAKLAKTKRRVMQPSTVADRGAFQQALGRAEATLGATRAYMREELAGAAASIETSGAPLDVERATRLAAALAWSTETLIQMATGLVAYAGAGALHLDSPIQRALRDLIGSGQHLVASNEALDVRGRTLVDAT